MRKVTRSNSERIGDALSGIEFFTATVSAGSFAGGAADLGVTASAVSRRVAALEDELGVQLLARTTRTLRLTADGAAFYDRCMRIVDEVREARDAFARGRKAPTGLLRVEAPVGLGRVVVAPALPAFLARYRDLRLDLTLRDQLVDPIAEGIDLLVRVGPLDASPLQRRSGGASLIAKRLGEVRVIHCASPEYLRRRGVPRSPTDLARHECLGYLRGDRPSPLRFGEAGEACDIQGSFNVNDASVLLTLAVAGHGVAAFFDFAAREALERGELVEILGDVATPPRPIHALYPPNRHLLPKVRAFLDFLGSLFGGKARR